MTTSEDDQSQTRMALSAHFAALVETLSESDPSVATRFQANLEKIYNGAREWDEPQIDLLESLKWTDDILQSLGRQRS